MRKYREKKTGENQFFPTFFCNFVPDMKRTLLLLTLASALLLLRPAPLAAAEQFVTFAPENFVWLSPDGACPILVDSGEDKGVLRAVANLQTDAERVSGVRPEVLTSPTASSTASTASARRLLIVGTVSSSHWVQQLLSCGKLSSDHLVGEREKFILTTVAHPMEGVDEAVVIAGSDKRGAIYGTYELSAQMGVSPWYYWADVPIAHRDTVSIRPGSYTDGTPAVRYRGIFLNDEWPALGNWAKDNFGDFNSAFYEKVFELILRLKGNFLWPAMWQSAFYDDDPQNGPLANEMGIAMGTSHHEPMALAQQGWKRRGQGAWDYTTNAATLRSFWREGIRRAKDWETVVTIGMRGDGDEAMGEGTNIALLQNIVKDQRNIIAQETQKRASDTPQVWALYKEVQDYYDHGMRVPDDVTLLLCDDNWGNIRKLPNLNARPRQGGYGMYYHVDYVGAPRNSKWANVTQIERLWEQMTMAYLYGVRQLWVLNVGDLKPMEFPTTFFLHLAWDPLRYTADNLSDFTTDFCRQQFGAEYAKEAARLISTYTKFNRRITPELLSDTTYSLTNYDEWRRVRDDYDALALDALRLEYLMPTDRRDAFDQLVAFPIQAMANIYDMYYAVAMNRSLASEGREEANLWADKAKECFQRDSLLTHHYNHTLSQGKWNHLMDQVHIGYTSWNDPPQNTLPTVTYVPTNPTKQQERLFHETDGCVSIEAEHYSRLHDGTDAHWTTIPNLGRTLSAVTTMPSTAMPDKDTYLEYDFTTTSPQDSLATVLLRFSATLNFNDNKGLSYAVSVDGREEQVVNINGHYDGSLGQWQADHIITTQTHHTLAEGTRHTLRYRPLDPALVLQKVMLDFGGLKPSFLGPPESETE